MFPCIEEKVQLIERYAKVELLITDRKTESVRAWDSIFDFGNNFEIIGKLIDLSFTQRSKHFNIGTVLLQMESDTYAPIGIMTSRVGGRYPNELCSRI